MYRTICDRCNNPSKWLENNKNFCHAHARWYIDEGPPPAPKGKGFSRRSVRVTFGRRWVVAYVTFNLAYWRCAKVSAGSMTDLRFGPVGIVTYRV